MVLGEVVGLVQIAILPEDVKLSLSNSVSYPVEAHVDCFGSFLSNVVVGDATGSAVVGAHWRRRLRMSHFFQGNA